jgi:site-specific recombinase XerD
MPIFSWFTNLTKGEPQSVAPVESSKRPAWVIDESKFLGSTQVRRLRRYGEELRERALIDPAGGFLQLRDWFMVELGLQCGLRVSEMAALRIGDLNIQNGDPSLIVRMGKGGKNRVVHFSLQFKQACSLFLEAKKSVGQQLDREAHILSKFTGEKITKRTLQKAFKKCLKGAKISAHFGIHALRHTHGTHLYKASRYNLRLVQDQLGHASISTTQVYASLFSKDVRRAVERLYRAE